MDDVLSTPANPFNPGDPMAIVWGIGHDDAASNRKPQPQNPINRHAYLKGYSAGLIVLARSGVRSPTTIHRLNGASTAPPEAAMTKPQSHVKAQRTKTGRFASKAKPKAEHYGAPDEAWDKAIDEGVARKPIPIPALPAGFIASERPGRPWPVGEVREGSKGKLVALEHIPIADQRSTEELIQAGVLGHAVSGHGRPTDAFRKALLGMNQGASAESPAPPGQGSVGPGPGGALSSGVTPKELLGLRQFAVHMAVQAVKGENEPITTTMARAKAIMDFLQRGE